MQTINKHYLIMLCAMIAVLCAQCASGFSGFRDEQVWTADEIKTGDWSQTDKVLAVVNDRPIIESDIMRRLEQIQRTQPIAPAKLAYEKSRLLDRYIDEALLLETAEEESIIVTDARVDNEIRKMMERSNIETMDLFRQRIEAEEKIPFDEYKSDLRKQIIMQQIMTIVITTNPASEEAAKAWYEENKQRLQEVNVAHILIRPLGVGFQAEKDANLRINNIRARVLAGESFEAIAQAESMDPGSAPKGGVLGWTQLGDLDPYFAGMASQMTYVGQISPVFKSSFGYHIIRFGGKRIAPFDEIEDRIYGMLSGRNRHEQFKKWVFDRRRRSEIRIYMDDYVQEQG